MLPYMIWAPKLAGIIDFVEFCGQHEQYERGVSDAHRKVVDVGYLALHILDLFSIDFW